MIGNYSNATLASGRGSCCWWRRSAQGRHYLLRTGGLRMSFLLVSAGMFQYWPQSEEVGFRMELFNSGNVSDSAHAGFASSPSSPRAAGNPTDMAKAAGEADRVSDRQPDDQKPSPFAVAPVPKRKPP